MNNRMRKITASFQDHASATVRQLTKLSLGSHGNSSRRKPPNASGSHSLATNDSEGSPTHQLPFDVVRLILKCLVSRLYSDIFAYIYDRPDSTPLLDRNLDALVSREQASISNSVLVCKLWLAAGNEFLYARPFLTSPNRIVKFSKTLKAVPEFGHRVQHLYIHNHFRTRADGNLAPSQDKRDTQKAIFSILKACDGLQSVAIHIPPASPLLPISIKDLFSDKGLHASKKLSKLTIFGSIWPSTKAGEDPPTFTGLNVDLPSLEVLCLRELDFPQNFVLPHFPGLKTLQIANCFFLNHGFEITSAEVPNLRTLELYENTPRLRLGHFESLHLERLHIVGLAELDMFTFLMTPSSSPVPLTHIVLGGNWTFAYCDVDNWRLPSSLVSLTIFFQLKHVVGPGIIDEAILSRIYLWMLKHPRLGDWKELIIRFNYDTEPTETYVELVLPSIRQLCELHGIELDIQTGRNYFNGWITKRLVGLN